MTIKICVRINVYGVYRSTNTLNFQKGVQNIENQTIFKVNTVRVYQMVQRRIISI